MGWDLILYQVGQGRLHWGNTCRKNWSQCRSGYVNGWEGWFQVVGTADANIPRKSSIWCVLGKWGQQGDWKEIYSGGNSEGGRCQGRNRAELSGCLGHCHGCGLYSEWDETNCRILRRGMTWSDIDKGSSQQLFRETRAKAEELSTRPWL